MSRTIYFRGSRLLFVVVPSYTGDFISSTMQWQISWDADSFFGSKLPIYAARDLYQARCMPAT
jgi:hypothetical protein